VEAAVAAHQVGHPADKVEFLDGHRRMARRARRDRRARDPAGLTSHIDLEGPVTLGLATAVPVPSLQVLGSFEGNGGSREGMEATESVSEHL
jgi:hypothetical protein